MRTRIIYILSFFLVYFSNLAFTVPADSASSAVVREAHTAVRLIADTPAVVPGRPFWVAVELTPEEHWHHYWKNPGDSGLATRITWTLPPGFTAGDIVWPYPEQISVPPLMTYGYNRQAALLVEVVSPADLSEGAPVILRAEVKWLSCKDICVPGTADLVLSLPVANEPLAADEDTRRSFEQAHLEVPKAPLQGLFTARRTGGRLELGLNAKIDPSRIKEMRFFPGQAGDIEHAAAQTLGWRQGKAVLQLVPAENRGKPLERLKGVVVVRPAVSMPGALEAFAVDLSVVRTAEFPASAGEPVHMTGRLSSGAYAGKVLLTLVLAFCGGVILNLMPCVLPVLAVKILALIHHAEERHEETWKHGLAFTAGVVSSFWVLGGGLVVLRLAGEKIGWGYQFQSPGFLVGLGVLFFIMAMNLFGLFEIGSRLAGAGSLNRFQNGLKASFLSGMLATIVATPCTAPFMGSAIGFALLQPVFVTMIIFTFLGLGMAAPFLLITSFPALLRFVPKPGVWMTHFKSFLGFLLIATVIWLSWVLGLQQGVSAMTLFLLGLVCLGVCLWLAGLRAQLRSGSRVRAVSLGMILIFGAAAGVLCRQAVMMPAVRQETSRTSSKIDWRPYSPELMDRLLAEKRLVFLDFTAAWCLSCQVNERVALEHPDVLKAFHEKGVVAVKADWTNHSEEITEALARFGKGSIPLYVLYPPGRPNEPLVLPEILTPAIVLEALDQVSERSR